MNISDAIVAGKYIKRESWADGTIDIYLKRCGLHFLMVIEHLNNRSEEHVYKLDISDILAEDWVIINKEIK